MQTAQNNNKAQPIVRTSQKQTKKSATSHSQALP